MIRVLNNKHFDSPTTGWQVNTQNLKRPYLEILSPYIDNIKIPFKPEDYNALTIPAGIDIGAMSMIDKVDIDGELVYALCTTDELEEDRTIVAYNLETEVGESITSAQFYNCVAISVEFKTVDFRDVLCGIFEVVDPTKAMSITTCCGYVGGISLSSQSVIYAASEEGRITPTIMKEVLRIRDGIKKEEILIPTKA